MKKIEFWVWLVSLLASLSWLCIALTVETVAWAIKGFSSPYFTLAIAVPASAVIGVLLWITVRRDKILAND